MSGTFSTNIMAQVTQVTQVTINAPEATGGVTSYRYLAELASNELDEEGVPERFLTVDAMVVEPTEQAILELLSEKGWLKHWGLVSYWQEENGDEF